MIFLPARIEDNPHLDRATYLVVGGVRIAAFAAVTLGAILLARPDRGAERIDPTTASVRWSRAARKW